MECPPCGKKFTGFENYQQHLESEKHKKNMLCIEERQNDSSVDSENSTSDFRYGGEIQCNVCDLSFDSLESFQNHATTPAHALKIMLKQANNSSTPTYSNSTINNHESNAINCSVELSSEKSVLPELNDSESYLSYGSCDICKKIFSGPEPYKQHLESAAHKKKVALQQNPTYIEGNVLKCEPCEKSFSGQVPYAQHMVSEIHRKKLQNIQFVEKYLQPGNSNSQVAHNGEKDENKLWFCNICKVQCSGMIPYQQHVEGSTHFKNEKRMQNFNSGNMAQLVNGNCQIYNDKSQNSFVKTDGVMNSMIQTSNSNEGKISEKCENVSQIMNGSYQKDIEIEQYNSLITGKVNELKIVSADELAEVIKIIPPHEKINFDVSTDSANEKPDIITQSVNENNEELGNIQDDNENSCGESLKKKEEKREFEVYQTCKICNTSLFNKDSAAEHFESKEHFEKRWGHKM